GEFEVICVDCESHDRSASIVRDIAQRDGRFVLLPGQVGTYSEGWVRALEAARAPYVLPLVSGAEFKGSGYLSGVRDALETTDAVAADIVVAESDLSHVRKGRMEPVPSAFHYYAPKRREHIAAVSSPFVYGKCFNAAFLRAHAEALATCEDIDGVDVWAQMLARAEFVSLLSSAPVEAEYRIPVLIKLGRTGEGLVRMCTDRYERLASLLGASGEGEHAPAMAILFNLMAHDLETLIYEREGMRLQQAITKLFAGEGGYGEEVPLDVRATDGFRFLDQATHCSYGQLVSLYALQRRKEHRKFVQRVQSSAFYRTEEAAKSFVKRNAPKSVMRMLTGH
ncbi:MAG: hypothetical protein IJ131_05080, partial [Eggerthellaceae bacterium]|nr:hypothetical protein [Eggerthellaceae bacterium]